MTFSYRLGFCVTYPNRQIPHHLDAFGKLDIFLSFTSRKSKLVFQIPKILDLKECVFY